MEDKEYLIFNILLFILLFTLLFMTAVSNSYNGQQCERERIKDAIINNPDITCVEYLKMKEE